MVLSNDSQIYFSRIIRPQNTVKIIADEGTAPGFAMVGTGGKGGSDRFGGGGGVRGRERGGRSENKRAGGYKLTRSGGEGFKYFFG